MGSQGGGSGGDGMEVGRSLQSLSRQGSLYSLTLDEVQNQLGGGGIGKPVGSMNLDELLRNVWSFEEENGLNLDSSSAATLNREPSFKVSRDLSKKTVEEVWKDIQQGKKKGDGISSERYSSRDGETGPALGEMTLEDFLVKAGVSSADGGGGAASQSNPQWMMNYQLQQQQQQQQQQKGMTVFMGVEQQQPLVVEIDAQMNTTTALSADTRKRGSDGVVVEKTVERRQKRMIKNRESAARSRARKQAYTHELENKVSRLEEEIERLRRHNKEVEKVLPSAAPPSEPKNRQLRRTSSALF